MAKRSARDLKLAALITKHGGHYPLTIIDEARDAGLPISLALALVEQESGGRNIFGCDTGQRSDPPYCRQKVTRERVQALLRHISRGGQSNGVGLTQITWPGYIRTAERMGGAHKPRLQCRVGFQVLAGLIKQHGRAGGLAAYNAGSPTSPVGRRYASEVLRRQDRWHRVLT